MQNLHSPLTSLANNGQISLFPGTINTPFSSLHQVLTRTTYFLCCLTILLLSFSNLCPSSIQPFTKKNSNETKFRSFSFLVCTGWKSEVELPDFLRHRKIAGSSQVLVVMTQERVEWKKKSSMTDTPNLDPVYRLTLYEPEIKKWCELPNSDWLPKHCHVIGVGSDLVVIGGWDVECWSGSKSVNIYSFLSGQWRRGTNMPEGRLFSGCETDSNRWVYVIGGQEHGFDEPKKTAMAYDVTEDKWIILPDMRLARSFCKVIYEAGKIHAIGGGLDDTTTETFDLSTGQWRDDPEHVLGENIHPHLCVHHDGIFYACDERYILTKQGDKWHPIAEIPSQFFSISKVAIHQGKLLLIGRSSFEEPQVAYVMDLITFAWMQLKVPHQYFGHIRSCFCLEL